MEKMSNNEKRQVKKSGAVTLKALAEHVGLAAGTVSLVLNSAPQSRSIPQQTKDRIFAAARKLKYQPNPFARALRLGPLTHANRSPYDLGKATSALMFVEAEHLMRAIHAIQQAGLRVPGDVSVVGVDQFPQA